MSATRPDLFIAVQLAPELTEDAAAAARLVEVCPVDIYAQREDGTLRVVRENLDECVLCGLCMDASPPGTVTVRKLYDGEALTA